MGQNTKCVHIIGAGLSGLAAAYELEQNGVEYKIYESASHPGGRVWTDEVEGFLLDRGFQVFLSSYPTARTSFRYENLGLKPFKNGALVWDGKQLLPFFNPLKHIEKLFSSLATSLATTADKFKILKLLAQTARINRVRPDTSRRSASAFLAEFGFSEKILRSFFFPFFRGVLLEENLETDSGYFRFLYSRFAAGKACLPAQGMKALPLELQSRLTKDKIFFNSTLQKIENDALIFTDGQRETFSTLILATDLITARSLLPDTFPTANQRKMHGVHTLYFALEGMPPVSEAVLILNGSGAGLINNLCFPSRVCSTYAPSGQSLCCVSVLKAASEGKSDEALHQAVKDELQLLFGTTAANWRFLKHYTLPHALPAYSPERIFNLPPNILLAGDYTTHPSIEGALLSGKTAAEVILEA